MIKQPWGLARLPAMTTQPPSAPAEHLAVVHALRVFSESAEHAVDEAGRGVGLHRTDLRALAYLMARAAAGEPVTASDLGAHLHLTRASATALVDRLAAAGHVRRHRTRATGGACWWSTRTRPAATDSARSNRCPSG